MGEDFNIMAYLVDIVILAAFVAFTIIGAKKGFINCIFGFVASIAAIVLAFTMANVVADLTGGLFGLRDTMQVSIVETLSQLTGFNVPIEPDADIAALLMEGNLSSIMVNLIAQNWVNTEIPAGYTLAMMAGETLAQMATAIITGVILYVVFRIGFVILKGIFNFVFSGGLLGSLNKLLGALVGLIEAVLIASILVAVLAMFPAMMPFLNSSIILTFLYNSNPLMWLISLFLML